jgi:tRNA A37 threonylcarbamoyladenosine biosynthesis protein TsaE
VLVVEWGERLPNEWLADALHIAITPAEGDVREFTADGRGERGRALLHTWCSLAEDW